MAANTLAAHQQHSLKDAVTWRGAFKGHLSIIVNCITSTCGGIEFKFHYCKSSAKLPI